MDNQWIIFERYIIKILGLIEVYSFDIKHIWNILIRN
jgi:hypothetical protein